MLELFSRHPIISGFKETSYVNAFILNALVTSLIAFTAVCAHDLLGKKIKKRSYRYLSTIGLTFMCAIICYGFMYMLFGFGGGMIAAS